MTWQRRRERDIYIYISIISPASGRFSITYRLRDLSEEIKFYSDAWGIPAGDWSRASWIDETERDRFRRDTYLFSGRYIIIRLTNAATWLPSTSRGFQISRFESGFQAGRSLVTVDNFLPPRLYTHLSLCWWVSISFNGEDFGGIFFRRFAKKKKKA